MTPQFILASRSPRRRDLLAHLGLPFRVIVPEVEEDAAPASPGQPEELTEALALAKAEAVARAEGGGIVIAADTIVVDGETILGKPVGRAEAAATLRRLRGRTHRVITGLAVLDAESGRPARSHVVTAVRMRLRTLLFSVRRFSFWRMRFSACLLLGMAT